MWPKFIKVEQSLFYYSLNTKKAAEAAFWGGSLGTIYLISSLILGFLLIYKSFRLYKSLERSDAVSTYKYSLLYLFLLMLAVMIDSSVNFLDF